MCQEGDFPPFFCVVGCWLQPRLWANNWAGPVLLLGLKFRGSWLESLALLFRVSLMLHWGQERILPPGPMGMAWEALYGLAGHGLCLVSLECIEPQWQQWVLPALIAQHHLGQGWRLSVSLGLVTVHGVGMWY